MLCPQEETAIIGPADRFCVTSASGCFQALSLPLAFPQQGFSFTKGIALSQWVTGYAFFSTFSIIASFIGGFLVDKFTAQKIAPIAVSTLSLAALTLYFISGGSGVFVYFTIFGLAQGMSYSATTPIWAELYGTKHLGAIKAIGALLLVLGVIPVIAGIASYIAINISRSPRSSA